MNDLQWSALIRTILALAIGPGSYLVARGVLSADEANALIPLLVPAVIAVGGFIIAKWGIQAHSAPALVAAVNSGAVPGVFVAADSKANAAVPQVLVTGDGDIRVDPEAKK